MFGFLFDILVNFMNDWRCEEGDVHIGRRAGTLVGELGILGDQTLRAESPWVATELHLVRGLIFVPWGGLKLQTGWK